MWLIAGLGNPGPKYQGNRHNVGFMVVDELARRSGATLRDKFGGLCATAPIAGQSSLLLKPMEFMNLSGYAVQRAAAFHRTPVEEIVVIHDEVDLDFGRLQVKTGGGHAGQNGVRSIIEQLGSPGFARVRVGVGRPAGGGKGERNIANWVLADFAADERRDAEELVERAADAVTAIVKDGPKAAMNQFNNKVLARS